MAMHFSILACGISWTEEPGGATVHGAAKCWTPLKQLSMHTRLCYARVCVHVCLWWSFSYQHNQNTEYIQHPTISLCPFVVTFSYPKSETGNYFALSFLECHIDEIIWYAKKSAAGVGGLEGLHLKGLYDFSAWAQIRPAGLVCFLFFFFNSCAHVSLLDLIKENQFLY